MKSEFSKTWNASKQPRKQVKFRANAPNHIKRTFMASPLDKALKAKYGRKSIEVRKGDEVKVMRGKFSGKQGKVGIVDVKNTRIQIEGIQRTKVGGEKMITWFHPSKIKIIILNSDDKKRLKAGKKESVDSGSSEKKVEKIETEEVKKEVGKIKKAVKKVAAKEKKE